MVILWIMRMPWIRWTLVHFTGMLTLPKGRGEVPHEHRRDIFCDKIKLFQRFFFSINKPFLIQVKFIFYNDARDFLKGCDVYNTV